MFVAGKRSNPEAMEALYANCPLIREVALVERQGVWIALVVPDGEALRRRGALGAVQRLHEELEHCGLQLPPTQRIADFEVTLEPLPRSNLGKLDRALVAERYGQLMDSASKSQAAVFPAVFPAAVCPEADRILINSSRSTRAVWDWLVHRYDDRKLSLDTSPQFDLDVDSLGWVALSLELERSVGLSLPGPVVSRILTLRDLLTEVKNAEPYGFERPATRFAQQKAGLVRRLIMAWSASSLFCAIRIVMKGLFRLRVLDVANLPATGPLVIAPNHASYLDPPAIAAALPRHLLSRTHWAGWVGITHTGAIRRFLSRATRVFPVDPDRDLAKALDAARAVVENGDSLVWFPEGRRSPDGKLLPLRPGIGSILEGRNCMVVPTYVAGTFEAWPLTRKWPRLQPVTVVFGTPVSVADLAAEGHGDSQASRIRCALERRLAQLEDRMALTRRSPPS